MEGSQGFRSVAKTVSGWMSTERSLHMSHVPRKSYAMRMRGRKKATRAMMKKSAMSGVSGKFADWVMSRFLNGLWDQFLG